MLQRFDQRNRDLLVNINGRLVHRDEAGISPFDSAVQGGDAVWEGLRLYEGRIFRLTEHLDRLRTSARAMAFPDIPTHDEITEELVRTQGFGLDDVPPGGTWLKLALTGNMSTGGTSIARTFEAHPDNVEIAETAARIVGLDVAGIDFICPDIATPVRETGGGIVEVNAAPGFRMHPHPTGGEPQYVAKPVSDSLFPPGTTARIPIVAVTGTNGKTTTARMIAHIMKGMGRKVGMTSTDGIFVDGRPVRRGDMSGPRSASSSASPRVACSATTSRSSRSSSGRPSSCS